MTLSTSELCLGRALTFTFGTFSHLVDSTSVNVLPKEGVKDISTGLTINKVIVSEYDFLEGVFLDAIVDVNSDMVIMKLDGDLGIPGHDVMIILVNRGSDSIAFYRNGWGYSLDIQYYEKAGKEHPMKRLSNDISIPHVTLIPPEESMVRCGSQENSEECTRRNNPVEICISDKEFGACVSWNEMYISKIQDWLINLPNSFSFEAVLPEIRSQLVEIDSSLVFGEDSLTKISEYGAKRWVNSPLIPYDMFREIFEVIPSGLSDSQFKRITTSYDKFMVNVPGSGDHETLIPESSLFLKESLGYDILTRDSHSLSDLCERVKINIGSYSCGEFIVDMTMVIISCKNRTIGEEVSSGKRKFLTDDNDPKTKFRRATSFIDI